MTAPARERLLEALIEITAEQGLDGVSIREVAARAGVSIGTVQYYCHTKDEMLVMAFQHVAARIVARVDGGEGTGAREVDGTVGRRLEDALLELLPLDDRRSTESRVYLAFAARAAVVPELAAVQHSLTAQLRAQVAAAFRAAQARGEARDDVDPDLASAATAALVDGLLLHLLTDPAGLSPSAAREILARHLRTHLRAGRDLGARAGRAG
jgi:AcrR family transcriptional regulator